jgi:hypothetical protein
MCLVEPKENQTRLSINSPMAVTISRVERPVEVAQGSKQADAARLYEIDPEYASFWCPHCKPSYCRDHWVLVRICDDGFYDCTQGTCPSRHRAERLAVQAHRGATRQKALRDPRRLLAVALGRVVDLGRVDLDEADAPAVP